MDALGELHLLRPWWLLAALPLGALVWRHLGAAGRRGAWEQACDAELLRTLRQDGGRRGIAAPLLAASAGLLAIVALAGPAWQRLPQPVLETSEARVIVLDLSRSMLAADVAPNRLEEARRGARELLNGLPGGRFGIVAFAGTAFTVLPLSDDRNTARHLLDVLEPGLMPVPGGNLAHALERALALLDGGGALRGDILVFTDSTAGVGAQATARAAAAAGHDLWVFGVGTPEGAPVPLPDGGFLRDRAGTVVRPALDEAALRALAAAGGGHYERLTAETLPVERFAWRPQELSSAGADGTFRTDAWRDEGRWLVLLLLPLAALAFRRGWIASACVVAVLAPAEPTWAFEWPEMFLNRDQQAQQLLRSGEAKAAARAFADPQWRGVAEYRAGDYGLAALAFGEGDRAVDHYNRGTALARARRFAEAVAAYDAALARDPAFEDARFNREIVARLAPPRQENVIAAGGSQSVPEAEGGGDGERRQPGDDAGDEAGGRSPGAKADAQPSRSGPGRAGEPAPGTPSSGAADAGPRADAAGPSTSGTSRGERSSRPAEADALRGDRGGADAATGRGAEDAGGAQAPRAGAAGEGRAGAGEISGEVAEQLLRHVDDDPGGLLRRKFRRQQERMGLPDEAAQPW